MSLNKLPLEFINILTCCSSKPCSPLLTVHALCILGGTLNNNSEVSTGDEKVVSTLTSHGTQECLLRVRKTEIGGFGEWLSFVSWKEVCVARTQRAVRFKVSE
jgi:hypothetical protein